jgi:hypothetical protein
VRSGFSSDGFTTNELLHSTGVEFLAACPDDATARRWCEAIERAVASETDLVTVSSAIQPFTYAQLIGGLYRAPRVVIGVPGMTDYQERINRYYGLESPSTVPKDDAVLERRHFGEVITLMDNLLQRSREARQIVPFYDSLPFSVRCASCGKRPAESIDSNDHPCCGVCQRKRNNGQINNAMDQIGFVTLEFVGFDRLRTQQRTISNYRRLCLELTDVLRRAVDPKENKQSLVTILSDGLGWIMIAVPVSSALETATTALERIGAHYGLKLPASVSAVVILAPTMAESRAAYTLSQQTLAHMRRMSESPTCSLDVRLTGQPFDRFRKPYTLDESRQLISGIKFLREIKLPATAFAELPEQIARGSAGLYYTFESAKLGNLYKQSLQRLEREWDVGASPGPRYFSMFAAALAVART